MTNNGENRIENTDYYYSENCNNNVISKPPNNWFPFLPILVYMPIITFTLGCKAFIRKNQFTAFYP